MDAPECESDHEVRDPMDDPGAAPRYEREEFPAAAADEHEDLSGEVGRYCSSLPRARLGEGVS